MRRAALALAAAAVVLAAALLGATNGLERWSYDARMQLRPERPPDDLAIIAIDDRTLNAPGRRWPLRRSLHAQAIDALRRAGVERIVYDVQFTEPSERPRDDLALLRAVGRAKGTVLATGESDGRGNTRVLGGDAQLRRIGARAGAANLPADPGGVIRRYDATVNGLASIPAIVGGGGGGLIDYRGPAGTVPTHSFTDLLADRVPAAALRGRTVVVGATAPTLQDLHVTPADPGRLMSGPEIQANAIWTAANGNPLRALPTWPAFVVLVLIALLAALRVRVAVAAALAYALFAVVAFVAAGVVLPVVAPLLGAVAAVVAVVAGRVGRETRARLAVTRELAGTQLEAVGRLARAAELRDDDTGDHIERMSRLCERVACELGRPASEALLLRQAAVLHDVGKIGLPDSILRKPGRLTPEEIEVMRRHTTEGAALLDGSRSPLLKLAEVIARTHHERWDGTGYPAGLAGERIPLPGRIAAVCDVFDALVSERPYKRAWTVAEAVAEIRAQSGRHFDPAAARALLAVIARDLPDDPGWRADVSPPQTERPASTGEPSTAASIRSTDAATQVKVGVSRFV